MRRPAEGGVGWLRSAGTGDVGSPTSTVEQQGRRNGARQNRGLGQRRAEHCNRVVEWLGVSPVEVADGRQRWWSAMKLTGRDRRGEGVSG